MHVAALFRIGIRIPSMTVSFQERVIMAISAIEYKGHELRAYSHQVFPPHGDPFAKGPRRFSSVVRIDLISATGAEPRRYATRFATADPTGSVDALNLAMQYGKDIIDGKVEAPPL
jgi:hypothetical protein